MTDFIADVNADASADTVAARSNALPDSHSDDGLALVTDFIANVNADVSADAAATGRNTFAHVHTSDGSDLLTDFVANANADVSAIVARSCALVDSQTDDDSEYASTDTAANTVATPTN